MTWDAENVRILCVYSKRHDKKRAASLHLGCKLWSFVFIGLDFIFEDKILQRMSVSISSNTLKWYFAFCLHGLISVYLLKENNGYCDSCPRQEWWSVILDVCVFSNTYVALKCYILALIRTRLPMHVHTHCKLFVMAHASLRIAS